MPSSLAMNHTSQTKQPKSIIFSLASLDHGKSAHVNSKEEAAVTLYCLTGERWWGQLPTAKLCSEEKNNLGADTFTDTYRGNRGSILGDGLGVGWGAAGSPSGCSCRCRGKRGFFWGLSRHHQFNLYEFQRLYLFSFGGYILPQFAFCFFKDQGWWGI
uniref:Uncharacterized protein n=1 Tax=Oryza sativa subsp. japonica TaxID=39947 RepID=Q75J41_ORYSJ|nr:hypothetical protein [Oryza sativa Japonica Group]